MDVRLRGLAQRDYILVKEIRKIAYEFQKHLFKDFSIEFFLV